jgi:hypothetical protein
MQYFKNSNGTNDKFQRISNRVNYFKECKEGVQIMCELVDNYAKEYAKEYVKEYADTKVKEAKKETSLQIVINMIKNGISDELIEKSVPSFSLEEIKLLSQSIQK